MQRKTVRTLLPFLIISCLSLNIAEAGEQAQVETFSPQGTVKGVRQVSVRFSEPMVTFGDPRLPAPFDIACPAKGQARWADQKNWIYDFDEDLPAGVACEFRVKPGLASLSGKPVGGNQTFSFSTGGPAILQSAPYEGNNVSEDQAFILTLDAEADEASVVANVFFSVEGIRNRVGARIVAGDDRKTILRTRRYAKDDPLHLVIQAAQAFPPGAKIKLNWGKGVRSKSGVPTEEAQTLSFKARGPFTARFSCDREHDGAGCIPFLPMGITFSAPVSKELLLKVSLKGPGNRTYKPELTGGRSGDEEDLGDGDTVGDSALAISFKGPFPESSAFTVEMPREIRDDAGRPLGNIANFPLTVRTDQFPPLAKFPAAFGIVELSDGAYLPVTLRNLEPAVTTRVLGVEARQNGVADKVLDLVENVTGKIHRMPSDREGMILKWLHETSRADRDKSVLKGVGGVREFDLPKPGGAKAFEVVGIPLKEPGFYVVEIESKVLGASLLETSLLGFKRPMFIHTAVLVTNMAAHFKRGRESSLVWVTTLDKGQPVKDALVAVRDCTGKVVWQGRTDGSGVAAIRQTLPTPVGKVSQEYLGRDEFLVTATSGADMTFVLSGWKDGIEPWRFGFQEGPYWRPAVAHTVFDRTLLRAGETVHMKHLLRTHSSNGLFLLDPARLPKGALILHSGSNERYGLNLSWDASNGVAETTWKIPADAKLGEYEVFLTAKPAAGAKKTAEEGDDDGGDEDNPPSHSLSARLHSGRFRVEEYRVPLMKGIIQTPKEPLVDASRMDVDLAVSYLSGGGAGHLPVKLRTQAQPRPVAFDAFDNFTFANGRVKEGTVRSDSPRWGGDESGEETEAQGPAAAAPARTTALVLEKTGTLRTRIDDLPKAAGPQDFLIEMEYQDPNGETQTVSGRVPLWPSRTLAGIAPDSWAASKEKMKFKAAVVDIAGKPVPGASVRVDLYEKTVSSHRKRIIGGFYAFEHVRQIRRVGAVCQGKTDAKGLLYCEAKSPVSGNVTLQAEATDPSGHAASPARRDIWVADKDDWWFDVSDSDRIDVLPERKRYEPGETAKLQVRMPFREATALVTVEREGILDAFVRPLSGKEPVVEFPVRGYHAPNVYVSVLCVRGRVGEQQPTALVDLGKPAFKLGVAEVRVGWKAHELAVNVSPEKGVYQVRDKATVRIKAARAAGGAVPKGTEVAVAVVDEGLLELSPNRSWDLLAAMMAPRGYEVDTATAQMQVVGKRHFGLKALPAGGGGGKQVTRELFDTLLLWKGRVALDNNGEAAVEIPLNDSLTSFRVAAIASGGAEFFGTGYATFRTTQDLQLLPGLPPLVREGDRFRAGVTVRNSTDRPMTVSVRATQTPVEDPESAAFRAGAAPAARTYPEWSGTLSPGEAREIGWDADVPAGIDSLKWEIAAKEKGGKAADRLLARQKVVAATPVRVFQATIAQVDGPFRLDVERPRDAIPGKGGVSVAFRAKLASGLGGVTAYMKKYPYVCLEQKTSRAVALRDAAMWKTVMAELPNFLDSDGLAKYFPKMRRGSDTLTAYLLAIADEAGWEIPSGPKEEMEDGLVKFVSGKIRRDSFLSTKDLAVRKIAALEALSRRGKAKPKLLSSIAIEPNLWPTSAVLDWVNVLSRVKEIPERDRRLKEAEQIVRSRLNFQGTMMSFSTEEQDYLWWLMVSGDYNAVRAVLTFLNFDSWNEDMPRLVRGALGRHHYGRWSTTTANAWGVLAMEKFSRKFESVPVTGTTNAALGDKSRGVGWAKAPAGAAASFAWPKGKGTLAVTHSGTGKPWATVQSLAAIPLTEPFSTGYKVRKTVTAVERKRKDAWSRGDVARVRLELESQADRTWVVVNDPVPAGSTILGSGLGRDSSLLTQGETEGQWWTWPAFEERSFEAFRSYFEYVPKGKWTVEYTVRLNNPGTFLLPATRVEALYSPEMFGELPNGAFKVGQ